MDNGNAPAFWNCRLDTSGRVVLPQQVRLNRGLNNGDELIVAIEDDAIVLRTYEEAMQRLQDMFCEGIPADVSLVDELIAERRTEAAREERD